MYVSNHFEYLDWSQNVSCTTKSHSDYVLCSIINEDPFISSCSGNMKYLQMNRLSAHTGSDLDIPEQNVN